MNDSQSTLSSICRKALALPVERRDRYLFVQCGDDWELFQKARREIAKNGAKPEPAAKEGSGWDADPEPSFSSLRTRTGRYVIRHVLGEGGMGVVYLADQEWPVRRRVALKVLRDTDHSVQTRARFQAERQAMAVMNHPRIARVYEAGVTTDGRLFFVMEFASGLPITEYCRATDAPFTVRIGLLVQVCRGIAHAHRRGVIHRDIKPSNILVADVDGKPAVKIIDFGVARAQDGHAGETGSPRELLGTLNYMSPEQAGTRSPEGDTRSDIYSLGAVAYETLTGSVPTDLAPAAPRGRRAVVTAVNGSVPDLPSVRARRAGRQAAARVLRNDLDWVVVKALEKDPASRYQTASDLAADFQRYLDRIPVTAAPRRSRGYRARLFLRRHRIMVVTLCCVAVAALLGILTTSHLSRSLSRSTVLADDRRDRILRLSDSILLEDYLAEVDDLVPPHPETADAMEAWLAKAEGLASRQEFHQGTLRFLNTMRETVGAGSTWNVEEEFHYDLLSALVLDLEKFVDPDPRVGAMARIRKRLDFSRRIVRESITLHRDEWNVAIRSIADTSECPLYRGLVIPPQVGLVPVRRNPKTSLWEFVDLATGRPPDRDGRGNVLVCEETGVVLVLLPGGRFRMGAPEAVPTDPILGNPNTDHFFRERPGHDVELEPFFLSKYEMTQAQWVRLAGWNPSKFAPGKEDGRSTLTHPVELITWNETLNILSQVGLTIPTEAQWEFGARAGTTTPWWTGPVHTSLRGAENLLDQSRVQSRSTEKMWWSDGFPDTAPVGRLLPNPFGLFDVLGNVREWCMDNYMEGYRFPHRDGDGLQLLHNGDKRTCRGGSYAHHPAGSRSGFRWVFAATDRDMVGVRPARAVVFEPPASLTASAGVPR